MPSPAFESEVLTRLAKIEGLLLGPTPSDFRLTMDPREWTGESYKEKMMSEAPKEYLELTAKMYEAFARKDAADNKMMSNGKPAAEFKKTLAEHAAKWALRAKPAKVAPSDDDSSDATLPF